MQLLRTCAAPKGSKRAQIRAFCNSEWSVKATWGESETYKTVTLIVTNLALWLQSLLKDIDSGLGVIRHTQEFSLEGYDRKQKL